jgi:hypothetical protein
MIFKILYIIAGYIFWITTQRILGLDAISQNSVIDRMHNLVRPINNYLRSNPKFMKYNFILSSLLIDINVSYVVIKYLLLDDDTRTITLLFSGFILRQICQYINRLPIPNNLIWFNPGFPSLFVTYHVENDFFFSGHTLIAFVSGFDIISNGDIMSKIYGTCFILYEVAVISFTFSHYFMDIYAAITTYFMLNYFYDSIYLHIF